MRGPIGGFFAWDGTGPALLVAGGSGIAPLMAMLRLARRTGRPDLVRLLVSVRTPGDLYFADELPGPETTIVYTRAAPPGTARPVGRLALADVAPLVRGGRRCSCADRPRSRTPPRTAARGRGTDCGHPGGALRTVRVNTTEGSRPDTFG